MFSSVLRPVSSIEALWKEKEMLIFNPKTFLGSTNASDFYEPSLLVRSTVTNQLVTWVEDCLKLNCAKCLGLYSRSANLSIIDLRSRISETEYTPYKCISTITQGRT